MTSTEPPVTVVVADAIQIFIVSAMKKLHFCHIATTIVVLHLSFLPGLSKKKKYIRFEYMEIFKTAATMRSCTITTFWNTQPLKNCCWLISIENTYMTYLQLKHIPQSFVLNPLDFDNLKAIHGFAEKRFDLLKFFWGAIKGNSLKKSNDRIS